MINGISSRNFSNVSFGVIVGPDSSNQYSKKVDNNGDTFQKEGTKKAKNSDWATWQKVAAIIGSIGIGAGAGAGTTALIMNSQNDDAPSAYVASAPIESEEELAKVADYAGSSIDALYGYNDVDGLVELTQKEEVYIPYGYSGLEDKESEIKEELASGDLDYEKQVVLEKKLDAIRAFEQNQKEYAIAVKDGEMYTFYMKKDVNVETFKKMFGIKDGVMAAYNDFDGFYDSELHGGEEEHFINYTEETLYEGQTYTVPVDSVKIGKLFDKLFKENGFIFSEVIKGEN